MIDPLGRRINAAPMFDGNGHGTHVCGTIAGGETPDGVAIGVAPQARINMAAVLVGDATIRTLLEGIDWCIQKGSDVINMSLGFNYYEPLFTQIFEVLIDRYEMLPVVAVGNENQGNTSSPGNAYNALGVGAVEKMGAPSHRRGLLQQRRQPRLSWTGAEPGCDQAGHRSAGRQSLLGHSACAAPMGPICSPIWMGHRWRRRMWQAFPPC